MALKSPSPMSVVLVLATRTMYIVQQYGSQWQRNWRGVDRNQPHPRRVLIAVKPRWPRNVADPISFRYASLQRCGVSDIPPGAGPTILLAAVIIAMAGAVVVVVVLGWTSPPVAASETAAATAAATEIPAASAAKYFCCDCGCCIACPPLTSPSLLPSTLSTCAGRSCPRGAHCVRVRRHLFSFSPRSIPLLFIR